MSVAMRVGRLDAAASTRSTLETPVLAGHRRADTRTDTEVQLGLSWLLKLRWGAVGGQLLALVLVRVILALDLPYVPLLGLVTFTAASNAVLTFVGQPTTSTWRLPAVLAVDVAVLTVMLAASGGASNPFTVFFLVHVALAALGRVSRAIRDRDRRLAEIASLGAQNERLATLSSFSANAAHELGSPLATIGLAAKELALGIRRESPDSALSSDADLVCREVARCREILADISARAGESVGEMPVRATPPRVLEELRRLMAPALVPHLEISYASEPSKQAVLVAPIKTLAQMLHNLIRNAFEAQEDADVLTPVELRIEAGERLCFHVLDRGAGLTHEVRAKLGEPFVTTKADRGGLGLGVYLARYNPAGHWYNWIRIRGSSESTAEETESHFSGWPTTGVGDTGRYAALNGVALTDDEGRGTIYLVARPSDVRANDWVRVHGHCLTHGEYVDFVRVPS